MVRPLPHELTDHIIDFLYADRRALSACSLVCHAWLAPARYHRFSHTTVRGRVEPFMELLAFSPGFAPYVRTFELDGARWPTRRHYATAEIISVLDRLPALRHFILATPFVGEDDIAALQRNTSFSRLRGLTIRNCTFTCGRDVVRLLSNPILEHVGLEYLALGTHNDELTDDSLKLLPPPPVQSACVAGLFWPAQARLAQWLVSAEDDTMHTLGARIESSVEANEVASLLDSVAQKIRNLDLTIDPETNFPGEQS